jgi:hypothetical protein
VINAINYLQYHDCIILMFTWLVTRYDGHPKSVESQPWNS